MSDMRDITFVYDILDAAVLGVGGGGCSCSYTDPDTSSTTVTDDLQVVIIRPV